ncbi:MAG TPA: OmpA family protein [Panacibacter sp.]|nr:OmpA family protein [Panacibacter sp.]
MGTQHFDEDSIKKFTLSGFLAFAAVFSFLMLMMQCHGDFVPITENGHGAATTESHEAAMPAEAVHEDNAGSTKVMLPGGVELNALKGGIEEQLVHFLNDAGTSGGKDVWFDFDNLNFKTGSAELTGESHAQVQNIIDILKAYPALKIKIGGYTDKTGDSIANLKLSQQRADAVLAALKEMGGNTAQIAGAEGYGSQYAKAAADAPDEDRKKDRRISLGVREK